MKPKHYKPHHHIHRTLKKHIPHAVHRAKKIVGFRYPKLLILVLSIVAAYFLFNQQGVVDFVSSFDKNDPLNIFIAGGLFSFGFSAAFSVGFFILSRPENILLASIIAGIGSTLADFTIFKTIKSSFVEEFKELEKKKGVRKIEEIVEKNKHVLIRHYFLYVFAGIMIAAPLPDEIGVSMLAGLTTINPLKLASICFVLHTLTIYLILYFAAGGL